MHRSGYWFYLAALCLIGIDGSSALADEVAAVVPIVSERQVRDLCVALRPVERVIFSGGAVEKSQAREKYVSEWERLHQAEFSLELSWGSFAVAEWDTSQKTVTISTERPFRAFDGRFTFFDADREELELEAIKGEVEALEAGLNRGTLSLVLVFRPAEAEGSPCVMGKAKPSYSLAVDLVSAELRAQGRLVARAAISDGFTPIASTQGTPSVQVRLASPSAEGGELQPELINTAVGAKRPELIKCYQAALVNQPALNGTLALKLSVGANGQVVVGTVVADSVGEPALVNCVKAAVSQARVGSKSARGVVLVEFERQ